MEIDLLSKFGSRRLVRLRIGKDGNISPSLLGPKFAHFRIDADADRGRFSVLIVGTTILRDAPFAEFPAPLHRISFRTRAYRGIGGAKPVPSGTDCPTAGISCRISKLSMIPGGPI